MNKEIISLVDETTNELLDAVSRFNNKQFNQVPFEGSWTAGQVAEHLLMAELGLPRVLKGNSQPTARRPDEFVAPIRSTFLDFTTKLKSPEFILPATGEKDRSGLQEALRKNRIEIRAIAETADLTLTFTDFPFPQVGTLTGIEWFTFLYCHAKRHTRQLNAIYDRIA